MNIEIIPTQKQDIVAISEAASEYAHQSKAKNTQRAYKASWKKFLDWCEKHSRKPLPAHTSAIVEYLAWMANNGARISTINLRRAAISYAHKITKNTDPTDAEEVRVVMAGIARKIGTAPQKKSQLALDDLKRLIASLPDGLTGKRDKAILLVGWAGAFRRSELVALDVGDIRMNGNLKIILRKSKTDQEGKGMTKHIPALKDKSICPVIAMREWLAISGINSGPIFRKIDRWGHIRETRLLPQAVASIVKRHVEAIGLDQYQFAGHSLRSGLLTAAAEAGEEMRDIMAVSGHKREATAIGYIQDAGLGAMHAVRAAFGEKE